MAQAALLFAIISFGKFILSLIKLLFLQVSAKKCDGVVGALTNTECEYKGKKNQTMYTFEVTIDEESGQSAATYQELVAGDRDNKVRKGQTYKFFVKDGKAQMLQSVIMEPVMSLAACAACIAIMVGCLVIMNLL